MDQKIPWYKQKTTWTAVAGVVGAVGAYVTGALTLAEAVGAAWAAAMVIFARQGIEKSK